MSTSDDWPDHDHDEPPEPPCRWDTWLAIGLFVALAAIIVVALARWMLAVLTLPSAV